MNADANGISIHYKLDGREGLLFENATTPIRAAPDSARLSIGWNTVLDKMLMIRPLPCALMCGMDSRAIRAKNSSDL